jgi:flagellar hook-associated protein 3 FlgL
MVDLMSTSVDGEYVFAGSNTTIPTISKDANYDKNGKITYNGDGFLRKVAVQEGSYRDRGVTGYDVAFYSASTAITGQDLTVADNERVVDSEGYEWKLSDDRLKLQRYDKNGHIFHPPVEIGVQNTPSTSFSVDLGVGANTDANGDFAIKIDGQSFVYTADGTKSASDIYTDLKTQITNAGYTVSSLNGDKFTISSTSDISVDVADQNLATSVTETNTNYTMKITNEVEATGDTQAVAGSVKATIPSQITTTTGETIDTSSLQFESKHNYFNDLNVVINALNGYSTNLDGTKADVMTDDGVNNTLRTVLGQTTDQYNATNIGHGELGGRNKIFEQANTSLQAQITHYNVLLQETNGADTTKLAMESNALQLTYTSIYSTISKMNQMSLVNYLN